jgi:hypothetical protein
MAAPATATVLGGWWNTQGVGSLSSISGRNNVQRQSLQGFGGRGGYGSVTRRVIYNALLGAAPGGVVQIQQPRIEPSVELGGVRKVLTGGQSLIYNTVTTAADATEMGEWLTRMSSFTSTPSPMNGDRNPLGTR